MDGDDDDSFPRLILHRPCLASPSLSTFPSDQERAPSPKKQKHIYHFRLIYLLFLLQIQKKILSLCLREKKLLIVFVFFFENHSVSVLCLRESSLSLSAGYLFPSQRVSRIQGVQLAA